MPRALRLESENASYHVINRGNYRAPIFHTDGAKQAFLRCLDETCLKTGWIVHAWALLSNHYHLAVTTPAANLAAGMHDLQATFALRFNCFRQERGHVFQGRYTSIAVEDGDILGSVCHYIHLNPVRAHLCAPSDLRRHPWTSVAPLFQPATRPSWFDPTPALRHAGDLADTPAGRNKYLEYLTWLAEDEPEQKRQRFDRMCRGWALGTAEFTQSLIVENRELQGCAKHLACEMREVYEAHWHTQLLSLLRRLGRKPSDLAAAGKSAEWKLAIAATLKATTTVTNPWLGQHMHLGNRHEIGRKVTAWLRAPNRALLRKLRYPTPHNPTPSPGRAANRTAHPGI